MISAHRKSNESTKPYIAKLFCEANKDAIWVLGKPFGVQELCKSLGIQSDDGFIKPQDTDKFAYIDESLGNALGTSIGIALANPGKMIICFISDAQLYMGSTLEAIFAMQTLRIKNILLVIDYNKLGSRNAIPDFNFKIFGDIPVYWVSPYPKSENWEPAQTPDKIGDSCVWVIKSYLIPEVQKFFNC